MNASGKTASEMSLRDWFAGQAMPLCTGVAKEYELRKWFGDLGGITTQQITAAQAYAYADAMMEHVSK